MHARRAIEPTVIDTLERRLPDPRLAEANHIGAFWTRNGSAEVDLVGGDTKPVAKTIAFVGSIKWCSTGRFTRAGSAASGHVTFMLTRVQP
jgi:uncharacterized protein